MSQALRRWASLAFLLLLGLAASASAGLGPASARSTAELERARAAFAGGRYLEALEHARRAADAAPGSLPEVLGRASMAEFMGEFDEAATFYGKATALAPADPTVLYRTASFAVRIGEYDRALASLDRLLELHPRQVRWLFAWGPGAVQSQLARQYPSLAHIAQIKIDILMEKDDLAAARALAQAHAIVTPGRDYCGEARRLGQSDKREELFQAFRLAALGQPGAADCVWWYGQWLTDEGYVRLGRLMVLEGVRATPSEGNKQSGRNYVRIRLAGGREVPKRAEQLVLIARQRYLRDDDVAGATRLFDEALRLAPGYARPYSYRAHIAREAGDPAAAVAWLQRGLQVDRDSWRTHRNLGRVLDQLERYPEAETHLRTAVGLFGDDAGARLALGRVLYAQGRYDEYLTETRAAISFFGQWRQQVPEARAFLKTFEQWGPGASLPPAPDPPIIIGWNHD
jgi:tetratricopeptide (TPR) repeat protein